MRVIAIAVLVASIAAASFIFTLLNPVTLIDAFKNEASMNALLIGDVHHLFLMEQVWQSYSSIQLLFFHPILSLSRCFDGTAVLLTGPWIVGAVWLLRARFSTNWLVVGLTILPCSIIPYAVGRIALHNNTIPEQCGPWLATMVLGLLYSLLGCAVCAVLELKSSRQSSDLKLA